MPNMFGGDQSHPAYMPRELESNEFLDGDNLYTLKDDGNIDVEKIDGGGYSTHMNVLPDGEMKEKFQKYLDKLKKTVTLSDVEKQFILEDYKEGDTFKRKGATFEVIKNDMNELVLKPIKSNIWHKTFMKNNIL